MQGRVESHGKGRSAEGDHAGSTTEREGATVKEETLSGYSARERGSRGRGETEKERPHRLPPEMTSPRDLGTETDLDRVNPHYARPNASRALSPPSSSLADLPVLSRVVSYYANAMLLGAGCCFCFCCCGCGHRCCIDRSQQTASPTPHPSHTTSRTPNESRYLVCHHHCYHHPSRP